MEQNVVYADINLSGRQKTTNRQQRSAKEEQRRCQITGGVATCFLVAAGITITILTIKVIDKPNKCCSDMWTKYKENCYYFSTNKTTWERSSQQCVSYGSQLVVAEDEEVLTFLIGCCRAYLTFWIGLNRKPEETWTWINGQHFDLNWKTQVQEKSGDCACVAKQSTQSKNCSTDLHWVCEKPLESCV